MRPRADPDESVVPAPPPALAALPAARRLTALGLDAASALVLVVLTLATWRSFTRAELVTAGLLALASLPAARAVVPWVSGRDRHGSAGQVIDLSGLVIALAALLVPVALVPLVCLPGFAVDYLWARRRLFAVVLNALTLTAVAQLAALVRVRLSDAGASGGSGGAGPTTAGWAVAAWAAAAVLVLGAFAWAPLGRWIVRGVPLDPANLVETVPVFQEATMVATAVLGATLWRIDPLLVIYLVGPVAMLQRLLFFREVQLAARTDDKTGLLNYRFFATCAAREVARARRTGQPLSLLVVDMDRLRDVNNTYGHQRGDEALVHVAAAIAAGARPYDLVCRFGGEEFLVLLPGTAVGAATEVAERLRQSIRRAPLFFGDDRVTITVSIGVAELGEARAGLARSAAGAAAAGDGHVLLERLVAAADARVYAAKGAGRDRVVAAALAV